MSDLDRLISILTDIAEHLKKLLGSSQSCPYTLFSWLEQCFVPFKSSKLKDNGYDLKMNINKHIKPHIQDKPLNEYTSLDISLALNKILSERMRQITRQIYFQSFREAVRAGYIPYNPVDNVDSISHKYDNGHSLSFPEQNEFLQVTASDKYSQLYRFYLLTGCRPSEPFAITFADISEYLHIPGTKTVHADRTIPISDNLRELINSLPRKDDRLFPYSYRSVRNHTRDVVVPKLSFSFTLKDLRHTFGTRCLEAGVSMKTVQKWLGHSDYGTTANFYSHITTEFELSELEKFNNKYPPR